MWKLCKFRMCWKHSQIVILQIQILHPKSVFSDWCKHSLIWWNSSIQMDGFYFITKECLGVIGYELRSSTTRSGDFISFWTVKQLLFCAREYWAHWYFKYMIVLNQETFAAWNTSAVISVHDHCGNTVCDWWNNNNNCFTALYPTLPGWAGNRTFTHWHLFYLSAVLYQLPPSTTIHSILAAQFPCLYNLCPSPLWSPC